MISHICIVRMSGKMCTRSVHLLQIGKVGFIIMIPNQFSFFLVLKTPSDAAMSLPASVSSAVHVLEIIMMYCFTGAMEEFRAPSNDEAVL